MDIPRIFNITESAHRIHNPFTPAKLATLGAALRLEPGTRVLDLGSGSGEMLCTWARDYGIIGTGIDMSQLFSDQAKRRAEELSVAGQVEFIHGDAAGYVAADRRRCQGLPCRFDSRLSHASRTARVFRQTRLRRRGNGSGRPRGLGQVRGRQMAHHAPMD